MEAMLREGDYVKNGTGGNRHLTGTEALLGRVLFRLSVRRGSFAPLPELGSELYRLGREKPSARAGAAKLYAAQALAGEPVQVEDAELLQEGDGVALRIRLRGENGEAWSVLLPMEESE